VRTAQGAHWLSISIDFRTGTPARLRAYADRFSARKQWRHYTRPRLKEELCGHRKLDAYRGAKMSHEPPTQADGGAAPASLG